MMIGLKQQFIEIAEKHLVHTEVSKRFQCITATTLKFISIRNFSYEFCLFHFQLDPLRAYNIDEQSMKGLPAAVI